MDSIFFMHKSRFQIVFLNAKKNNNLILLKKAFVKINFQTI